MANTSSAIRHIIDKLKTHITLTHEGVSIVDAFDPDEEPDGAGAVAVEITGQEQPTPGLPDWFLSFSIVGMTFVSVDEDKTIIEDTFCDVLRSVSSWTPATISDVAPGSAVLCGIQPVTNGAIRHDATRRMFTADFKLVFTNLNF